MSDAATRPQGGLGTDFTQGPVLPLLLRFMLPFLLANLLNSLYNTVDTVIIGQYVGSTGIVAVSLGGKMLNLFTNVGIALAGGGQILISQLVGAGRREELNSAIGTMLTEMFVLALAFAVVTLALSRQIITWLNTQPEAFDAALAYLRITCVGLPLIFGYNAISSVLRGMGDSARPLVFIAIAAAFNLVGDLVFIVAFGLGAAGTAIATVLGQGLSLAFAVAYLYRRREQFGFDFRWQSFVRVDRRKLVIMAKLGFPTALRSFCITGTQLVMMGFVNTFGLAASAAYFIGDKIYHLSNVIAASIMQASGSMVGQNFGAGKHERIRLVVRNANLVSLGAAVLLSVPALLVPETIFRLFDNDPAVLPYARAFMAISALIYLLSSFMVYEGVMVGTGNAVLSMIAGILDGMVFRVSLSFLFAYRLNMGVTGFFLADALSRIAPIGIGGIYYHSGVWKKRKPLMVEPDQKA